MLQHGNLRSKETKQKLNFSYLEPLEGLDADDIGADDLHGRTGENGSLLIEEEKLSQLLPTPSIDKLGWSSYA